MNVLQVISGELTFQFEPAEEGGYFASVPDLPGCFSEGRDLDEALANIREALQLFVEGCRSEGIPLPERYRSLALAGQKRASRTQSQALRAHAVR
jgi:predicted RNase H-like HicB family nuclease